MSGPEFGQSFDQQPQRRATIEHLLGLPAGTLSDSAARQAREAPAHAPAAQPIGISLNRQQIASLVLQPELVRTANLPNGQRLEIL